MSVNTFKRAELYFWDFVIRALSESRVLRYAIPKAYRLAHNKNILNMTLAVLCTSIGGYFTGVLLKIILSLYR